MRIVIHPFPQKMRNGMPSAKAYPVEKWREVLAALSCYGAQIAQIGVKGEEKLAPTFYANASVLTLKKLVEECDTWVCCDSFLQHLAHHVGKPGVVIWSKSDPKIFGYPYNRNLYVSSSYFRRAQFDLWEAETYDPKAFVEPEVVVRAVMEMANGVLEPAMAEELKK